jgi:hypothetical protein
MSLPFKEVRFPILNSKRNRKDMGLLEKDAFPMTRLAFGCYSSDISCCWFKTNLPGA